MVTFAGTGSAGGRSGSGQIGEMQKANGSLTLRLSAKAWSGESLQSHKP